MSRHDFVVRPEHFVRYLRKTLRMPADEVRLPRMGIIVFGGEDFRALRRLARARNRPANRWLCEGLAGDVPVAIARSQIGAPAAAILMEEMAARGVRGFLAFGACGSLRDDLRIGDVVLPAFAYPDEGTSRHYGAPKRPRPDIGLRKALAGTCAVRDVPFREGGVWTMDAPYRESWSRARTLARRGVLAVDMEASALYAVARVRNLRAASLMVVSDELGGDGWNPGFHDPAFLAGKRKAYRVVLDALAGGSR